MRDNTRLLRKLWRRLDFVIGACVARLRGAKVGRGSRISLSAKIWLDRGGVVRIGEGCRVLHGAILAPHAGGVIEIGDDCSINPYCILYGHGGLKIGNRVRIAAHTVVIPANHQYADVDGEYIHTGVSQRGIQIGDDVWIGAGVRVLDGVRIASRVTVGAGAVVTRSLLVPGIYAGVPAQLIRPYEEGR